MSSPWRAGLDIVSGVALLWQTRTAPRDGRTVVVLDVPVGQCTACDEVWLTMDVAKKLDAMFTQLLDAGAEAAHVHWDECTIAA